jgi:hypothetical protein
MNHLMRIGAGAIVFTALVAIPAQAQDVSGMWTAFVELSVGSGEPTLVFKQEGNALTGTYEGTFGSAELTGTVDGNAIEFSFGAEGAGKAVYTGTIDGDTMKGTCDYGEAGEGTWKADRQ